ncbi:MAG TPA: four helix bundle protein [Terriglobales bacterium]|nr:four helix bundle protein [Terriglobales bacterium]
MSNFHDLKVWQKAHELTLAVYRATSKFPREEIYGLVAQMRRCAVSVGSNIAEGRGRDGDVEFARFLAIALGSLTELEYQLLLSRDLGYIGDSEHEKLNVSVAEVNRMLLGLQVSVKKAAARAGR